MAAGACRALAIVVPALAAEVALDAFLHLPAGVRVAWLVGVAALGAWAAGRVVRQALARLDPVRIAAEIEARHPELGETIESAAELWEKRGAAKLGYSVELIDALIEKAVADSAGIDFATAGGDAGLRRWGRLLAAAAAVSAVALALPGARLGPAVGRLARPLASGREARVVIEVEPGDATLVSGDDLVVTARVRAAAGAEAPAPPTAAPVLQLELEGEAPVDRPMAAADGGAYRATVPGVRSALRYSVKAGRETSRRFSVRVIDRPFVAGIRLDYEFPRYSGLVPRTVDENSGDITALVGTNVTITVTPSKPVAGADLAFAGGVRQAFERAGGQALRTTLTVTESTTYAIEMTDRDGLTNPDPAAWSIVAVRDEHPLVRIVEPGEDRVAPADMLLPVAASAVDDYGIGRLALHYAVQGGTTEGTLALAEPGPRAPRELAGRVLWDLRDTGAVPGSVLIYYAAVTDNDAVTGPKTARSESYLVRLPSVAELYSRVREEQDAIADDLEEVLGEQEDVREQFESLKEEMRSNPTLDWQKEERIEAALQRQEKVVDDATAIVDRLDELTADMSESDRVTLDALEKTREIADLLEEVATDEMRELLERIRQAMGDIKPQQLAAAMEQMTLTQEDYLRRLEQTLNLLRRVKAEQELADVANRAQDLAEREGRVAEEASQRRDGEPCDALAAEQASLKEEAEKLLADLEKAAESMEPLDRSTASDMRAAAEETRQAGTLEKMERGRAKLAESKPSEAAGACQSAANDLKTLFTRASACQGGAACSLRQRDREATLRAVDELLGVSAEQGKILKAVETRERIPRGALVELVAKQTDLAEALTATAQRLFTVSKESFVIDAGVHRRIGLAQAAMLRAASRIADGGSTPGRKEARDALGQVNALIVDLLTTSQQSSPSSGGSALEELMQQLQSMAERQSSLNDLTRLLERQTQELGMGPQASRQLADMMAAQERLLEDARRLAREFGDRREILGRLDDTADEMAKALAEMEKTGASQQTVDRQKRILSRLLDAQRSLRRREYTRERLSRPGEEYARERPGALPDDATRATQRLREDLLRAMERAYPGEYRDLIRAYFEGLSQDARGGSEGR